EVRYTLDDRPFGMTCRVERLAPENGGKAGAPELDVEGAEDGVLDLGDEEQLREVVDEEGFEVVRLKGELAFDTPVLAGPVHHVEHGPACIGKDLVYCCASHPHEDVG